MIRNMKIVKEKGYVGQPKTKMNTIHFQDFMLWVVMKSNNTVLFCFINNARQAGRFYYTEKKLTASVVLCSTFHHFF